MWNWANNLLKDRAPGIRRSIKRLAAPWLRADTRVRIPKRVAGHLIWTQPRLLTSDLPEEHIVRWAFQALPRGGTFFDVGAHYGWISTLAAIHVGSAGQVVSFEPSPVLVDILELHRRANRLSQMQIVRAAISNTEDPESSFFLINEGLSSRNSLTIGADDVPYIDRENKTQMRVRSLTLDGFARSSGTVPNLIKIDVEGAELLVLEGAQELLAAHHPDLIVGVHPFWLPPSHSVDQIFRFLRNFDYEIIESHKVEFQASYIADYFCRYRPTPN